VGGCYGGTRACSSIGYSNIAAESSHTQHETPDTVVAQPSHKGLNICFVCSSLLEEHTSPATLSGQRSLMHGYSERSPTSVPNTPPPRPEPKPYPTGPHQSSMAIPWCDVNYEFAMGFPSARQYAGDSGTGRYPAGFWATQGSRKVKNTEGEFQCWSCVLLHEEKRVFKSTNSLRNEAEEGQQPPKETQAGAVRVFEERKEVDGEDETELEGWSRRWKRLSRCLGETSVQTGWLTSIKGVE
jgi:hypothetical protein